MDSSAITVLVVDDQATFRAVARTVVAMTSGFEIVGEAESGEDAVRIATESSPDLVLMDINLPGINGVEATRQITERLPGTVVVLMSTYGVDDLPPEAGSCGAASYVHKEDLEPDVLHDAAVALGSP